METIVHYIKLALPNLGGEEKAELQTAIAEWHDLKKALVDCKRRLKALEDLEG